MGQLYEDWLSSGENWMRSSLVVNASRTQSSKRKGKYRMTTYKDLKKQHGPGVAKTLRDSKKEQEKNKKPDDGITYWQEHPDFPGKEDRHIKSGFTLA